MTKYIPVTDDCYEWFQHIRKIEVESVIDGKNVKRKMTIQENEAVILLLNMWEAGNMGKQASDCIKDPKTPFPKKKKIFSHYNGIFYRSD